MIKLTIASCLIAFASGGGIYYIFRLLKKDAVHLISGLFWICVFMAIAFFSIFPHFLDTLASIVMMKNRMFFLVMTAVLVLFGMQLARTIELSRLEKKINKAIQEHAALEFRLTEIDTKMEELKEEIKKQKKTKEVQSG